ncbi:helix-turn-helix domain-containing protein [Gayadomonas joobiniege]|uniref:helix-turn-helix domain-containing protein n=1 Tax=Gayadomonas joobiniege TaxID=1234606 RepID=UPI00037717B7|nr:helix-turn-helix domain-containing protein [Gayadomonas joobiniege]
MQSLETNSNSTLNGAPKVSIANTFDASWQAEHLTNWQQSYDQISRGAFRGQLKQVNLPQLDISREFSSQALRQECYVERGGFWLGFSQGVQDSRLNGVRANNQSLLWHSGQQDFELITEQNTVIYSVLLERSLLPDNFYEPAKVASVPASQVNAFLYLLNRLLNPAHQYWRASCQQRVITDAVQSLISGSQTCSVTKPSFKRRQQIIQEIRAYIMSTDTHLPITMADLCMLTHVSRRTLQACFQDVLGISAKTFVKAVRLNQIRRCLSDFHDQRPIYQIANDFGYFHLGQFSQDYKSMFGETAGQTRLNAQRLQEIG